MIFSSNYYDLLVYTYFISFVIPIWVFSNIGLQIWSSRGSVIKVGSENFWAEFCWTFIPYIFVSFLCYLNMQYILEGEALQEVSEKSNIVKVVGHQWYWSYSDSLLNEGFYDSFITDFVGLVDKPLRVGMGVPCKFMVTSADVIHSFSLPDFSLKLDAIPGRIVSDTIIPCRCGVFVGYCSELCGAGHAYMPIVMEVVSSE